MVTLLNEQDESVVAQNILGVIDDNVERLERELCTSVLDREVYLQKIGALNAMRTVQQRQQKIYDTKFNV